MKSMSADDSACREGLGSRACKRFEDFRAAFGDVELAIGILCALCLIGLLGAARIAIGLGSWSLLLGPVDLT